MDPAAAPFAERPDWADVRPSLEDIWEAFWRLSSDRPKLVLIAIEASVAGSSVMSKIQHGAIPFSSIDRYAQRLGYAGEGFDEFYGLIREMDDEYLKAMAGEAAADREEIPPSDG